MKVTVLYFARLREALGIDREIVVLPAQAGSVADLLEQLRARNGAWQTLLAASAPYRIAVNQDMASSATILREGDEVAIFPPVTGG